jgi:hypothetical protein
VLELELVGPCPKPPTFGESQSRQGAGVADDWILRIGKCCISCSIVRLWKKMSNSSHESYSREQTVAAGSDRSFGFVMAAVLAVVTVVGWWRGGTFWPWTLGLAGALLAAALIYPVVLKPLNRWWFKFGLLLHKIVSPIVMAFLFYCTVLPTGIVMRLLRKDILRLTRRPEAESYWIARQPSGPAPETMKDQF